jgi:hypothetical protein
MRNLRHGPKDIALPALLDMAVKYNGQVYLLEFKVVERETEGKALAQIKEKGYADKYRSPDQPIHLIGVEFSKKERNMAGFAVEPFVGRLALEKNHLHRPCE